MTRIFAIVTTCGALVLTPGVHAQSSGLVRIPGSYTKTIPRLVNEVAPIYPPRSDGPEHLSLFLNVTVDDGGRVTEVICDADIRAEFAAMREAVVNAVSHWRFEPLRVWDREGQVVAAFIVELTVFLRTRPESPALGRTMPNVFAYDPTTAPTNAPRLQPGVKVMSKKGSISQRPSPFRFPGGMNSLLTPDFGFWGRDEFAPVLYATGLASYFDPSPLESPKQKRSPLLEGTSCKSLVAQYVGLRGRLRGRLTRLLMPNDNAAAAYDAGFADADVLMNLPAYSCNSPALQTLFASLNRVASGPLFTK